MTDPTTIRRAAPAVDTSAERLTFLRDAIRRGMELSDLAIPEMPAAFDTLLAALAARQREAVSEALANWGEHSATCRLRRGEGTDRPLRLAEHACSCGFDQALDRLAPKAGW